MKLVALLGAAALMVKRAESTPPPVPSLDHHNDISQRDSSETFSRRIIHGRRQSRGEPPPSLGEGKSILQAVASPPSPLPAPTPPLPPPPPAADSPSSGSSPDYSMSMEDWTLPESMFPEAKPVATNSPGSTSIVIMTQTQMVNVTVSVTASAEPEQPTEHNGPHIPTTSPCHKDLKPTGPPPRPEWSALPFRTSQPAVTRTRTSTAEIWMTISSVHSNGSNKNKPHATKTATASFAPKKIAPTLSATTTVCASSAPSGTPLPDRIHCGVHGLPVGDYFVAQFIEDESGVPVTLDGCWKSCGSVWGSTHGCQSYDYYLNDLGAPRCDLYSRDVASAVDAIDNHEPNTWFDLACGDPGDPKWHHAPQEYFEVSPPVAIAVAAQTPGPVPTPTLTSIRREGSRKSSRV
ncbi:hypothetical protein B0T17DRAFT_619066 [Bombardia bombarda]|uniref:Uncharacterized protein n=1 Tax=Bombardia bombarda TaxID=252184 RepID=A0AA39WNA0_9PEZI|nr:hypothetical protein B0T17DRAFT_619066 [Bombardia bombarda]